MGEAKIDLDRGRARAWQRTEVARRLAEVDAGTPGHREVMQEEIDAAFDRAFTNADPT